MAAGGGGGAESQGSQHSWELPAASGSQQPPQKRVRRRAGGEPQEAQGSQHAWERPGAERASDEVPESAAESGQALADLLLQLHLEGKLSAKHTCQISFYAHKAGATGPVAAYAFRPDAPSGHFQRHLDAVAGLKEKSAFHVIAVPAFSKRFEERGTVQLQVLPPHEQLHQEVCEDPGLAGQLRRAKWPASFGRHPVARAAGNQPVLPIALYLDGAQYTKAGASLLVFVVVNLLSGVRHLACVLDKRRLCRCGCRGWCTLRPILAFLRWSFGALAAGAYPSRDHGGAAWPPSDERASLAGLPLACGKAAVQQVRGDWAEFSHTLGFPTWHSSDYPCLWCRAEHDSLYEFSAEWELNDHSSYEAACERCEIHAAFASQAALAQVAELLFWDLRTYGQRGRCLSQPVPSLGLQKGDRLEPSDQLPDVADFETQATPCVVVFWRSTNETTTRHRNPLFDAAIGITVQSLKVDSLHCLALGVWQVVLSAIIAAMIDHDVYGAAAAGATTIESRRAHFFQRFGKDLQQWMAKRGKGLTRVQTDFTLPLRLKGGETKTLLTFMPSMLESGLCQGMDKRGAMVKAVQALLLNYDTLEDGTRQLWSKTAQKD